MHLTLHEGKVITIQPDSSPTVLDAATREILLRGEPLLPNYSIVSPFEYKVKTYKNLALVLPTYFPACQFIISLNDGAILVTGDSFHHGAMETYGEQLFAVVDLWRKTNTVYCLDMNTGSLVWEKAVNNRVNNIFVDEQHVYLKSYIEDGHTLVFDKSMVLIPPPHQELHLLNRVKESFDSSPYADFIEDRAKAEALFGDKKGYQISEAMNLPDGSIVASSVSSLSRLKPLIHFDNKKGTRWDAEIDINKSTRSMHGFEGIRFSFVANDNALFYASSYGGIECRNIANGELIWKYHFPRKSMSQWTADFPIKLSRFSIANWIYETAETHWWDTRGITRPRDNIHSFFYNFEKDFYTEDKKKYDEDMFIAPQSPAADATNTTQSFRTIVDTKTIQFNATGARIMNWLALTVTILALFYYWVAAHQPKKALKLLVGLVVFNLFVIVFFGRYDRFLFRILVVGTLYAYLCVGRLLRKKEMPKEITMEAAEPSLTAEMPTAPEKYDDVPIPGTRT